MELRIYQADAFTDKLFSGNPAAVCPLMEWPDDSLMQQIARENNLAETAFYVKKDDVYHIRWFTPAVEVDLCGHATLAAAAVLYGFEGHTSDKINFHSHLSGELTVSRKGDLLSLNFPADIFEPVPLSAELFAGFNIQPIEAYKGKTDYMFVFSSEAEICALHPDFRVITGLPCRGIIATAKGDRSDFVSRFFAPQSGIDEDPVTGSAHTTLVPYWAKKLGKDKLSAVQLSQRKGYLECEHLGERVQISGKATMYLIGKIFV